MYSKHFPDIIKPLGKDLIFNLKNDENTIYLTFDDGPHPEITPWVMDQLKVYDAKGTFFLVGENAQANPKIVESLVSNGHGIGNHTQHHINGWKTKNPDYFDDTAECAVNVKSSLFRPPYGKITRSQAKHLSEHYKVVMWSDLSADFDSKYSVEQCLSYATKKVTSGSIIVFHDSEKAWTRLENLLPLCLKYYSSKGFKMKVIK